MTPRQKAKIRAVKNKLCKIEDKLGEIFIDKKNSEKTIRTVMIQRIELDNCIEVLQNLLPYIIKRYN